jgi:hypothetical protein
MHRIRLQFSFPYVPPNGISNKMGGIHRRTSSISAEDQFTNAETIRVSGLMEGSELRLREPQPHKVNLHQIGQLHLPVCGK